MPAQLLVGTGGGRFADASDRAGPPWRVDRLGRGLATGDLDNDGRVNLLILSQNQPLAYFHNRSAGGHSLTLRLEGTESNRDAVGARVTVVAGGRRRNAWRIGGGSYQSASEGRLHFGLGDAERAEEIEVTWPSGRVGRYGPLPVERGISAEGGGRRAGGPQRFQPAARGFGRDDVPGPGPDRRQGDFTGLVR